MSISKIAHLSDLHIRKSPLRNNEYENVFQDLYKSLEEHKPQRVVISGDLVHDFLDLQGEQLIMCSEFLNKLAQIARVVIIRGNHDVRKSHLSRVDSIEAIVRSINNPNVQYLNETNFFDDENVTWAVWKHGDKINNNNNPWTCHKKYQRKEGQIYIDLFHDPINGCKSNAGYEFDSKTYYKLSDFKANFLMAGDIHHQQYLDKERKKLTQEV
jgi:DNA repair exonuclease SbcCD nuclease subunit